MVGYGCGAEDDCVASYGAGFARGVFEVFEVFGFEFVWVVAVFCRWEEDFLDQVMSYLVLYVPGHDAAGGEDEDVA